MGNRYRRRLFSLGCSCSYLSLGIWPPAPSLEVVLLGLYVHCAVEQLLVLSEQKRTPMSVWEKKPTMIIRVTKEWAKFRSAGCSPYPFKSPSTHVLVLLVSTVPIVLSDQ